LHLCHMTEALKFEYLRVTDLTDDLLARLGFDGWELVAMGHTSTGASVPSAFFKRVMAPIEPVVRTKALKPAETKVARNGPD
jgi:hypothetical protein